MMDQSDQLKDACKQLYEARVHLRKILSFVILDDEGCDDVYIYDLEGCAQTVRDALYFIKNEGLVLGSEPEWWIQARKWVDEIGGEDGEDMRLILAAHFGLD
jgi:hypothetical protein